MATDAADTLTVEAAMATAHAADSRDGRPTVAPIAAELPAEHVAMPVAEPAVMRVERPEAAHLRLAVDSAAAEPAADLAAAADMPAAVVAVAAMQVAAADTGKIGSSAAHPRSTRSCPTKPVCFGRRALCFWGSH